MAVTRRRKKKRTRGARIRGVVPPISSAAHDRRSNVNYIINTLPEKTSRAVSGGAKPKKKKLSLRELLYADDAEGLFRLITFLPLFLGAWLASGLVLAEPITFLLITGAIILAHYEQHIRRTDVIFVRDLRMMLYLAQGGLLFLFFQQTDDYFTILLAAAALMLVQAYNYLPMATPASVLCGCLALVLEMALFPLLGMESQLYKLAYQPSWQHTIVGFLPGLILAAVIVVKHSDVFEKAGWPRTIVRSKDGKGTLRPGALSAVFCLLLFAGPAIPLSVAPMAKVAFPTPFLITALAYLLMPRIAQAFLEREWPDRLVALHCTNLAAVMSLATFFAAMVAKLGWF